MYFTFYDCKLIFTNKDFTFHYNWHVFMKMLSIIVVTPSDQVLGINGLWFGQTNNKK